MSWLSRFAHYDKVLVAGLGIGLVGLVGAMRFILEQYRADAEIKPVQPKTQYITQDTEDSLKLSTLDTLLGHYNYAIRETAAKIVCDRAAHDDSIINTLLWGITRPEYEERFRNLQCLAIITDQQSLHHLNDEKAYTALVRSLELCLDPEQEPLDDVSFDEYYLRDMTEKLCLMFVSQLVSRYSAAQLVRAGFVEKWLARQNWGVARETNFACYLHHKRNRLTDIVREVEKSAAGRAALAKAGLVSLRGDGKPNMSSLSEYDLVISMRMDMDANERQRLAREQMPAGRTVDQGLDEQRIRRHREAMVLSDGSRPITREDIIQREPHSPS